MCNGDDIRNGENGACSWYHNEKLGSGDAGSVSCIRGREVSGDGGGIVLFVCICGNSSDGSDADLCARDGNCKVGTCDGDICICVRIEVDKDGRVCGETGGVNNGVGESDIRLCRNGDTCSDGTTVEFVLYIYTHAHTHTATLSTRTTLKYTGADRGGASVGGQYPFVT